MSTYTNYVQMPPPHTPNNSHTYTHTHTHTHIHAHTLGLIPFTESNNPFEAPIGGI